MFSENDGSLPDIVISVPNEGAVPLCYALLQNCANTIVTRGAYYWSTVDEREVPVSFGDNPATLVASGVAQPFHVVFGEVRSPSGHSIPDLGAFVFSDMISLDYKMGREWTGDSVFGLFEILQGLLELSGGELSHEGNINDQGTELQDAFYTWANAAT